MTDHGTLPSRPESLAARPLTPNQRAWRRFKRNRPALLSVGFFSFVIAVVLVWPVLEKPWIAGHVPGVLQAMTFSPDQLSEFQFASPSATHWFGTDMHGRDLLARTMVGARVSLLVGLVGAGVSLVIGVLWGMLSGYIGGKVDGFMMRFVDVLYSLPSIVFVIVIITTLEPLLRTVLTNSAEGMRLIFLFIGLGAVSWLTMARIVRGEVLSLRNRSFVQASRALGATHAHILRRHILPNIMGLVIVYVTLTIPAVVLYESFLSYLGLGIQPPMASWGSLIADGAQQLNPVRQYWWLLVFPCGMLVSTLMALNFVGDGLRDAYDPRGDR